MTTTQHRQLVRFHETVFVFADAEEDVRGRTVLDEHGESCGVVDALYVDPIERRICFLEVVNGDMEGERTFLLPVESITGVTPWFVRVNRMYEEGAGTGCYRPELAPAAHAVAASDLMHPGVHY